MPRNVGMLQDGFQLAAEIDVVAVAEVIERLDAHAIAGEQEAFTRLGPDGHCEHAAHPGKAVGVPLQEGAQDGFGIAVAAEAMAQRFQVAADLQVIVDLAVEGDDGVGVVTSEGLVAAAQVDNFQAHRAKGGFAAFENPLLIGTTMI